MLTLIHVSSLHCAGVDGTLHQHREILGIIALCLLGNSLQVQLFQALLSHE